MRVEIHGDFDDPKLKAGWLEIQHESDLFPQARWHWCATWWKWMGRSKGLHIVGVYDSKDKCIAVAPFFKDSLFGITYLRALPKNFGDFYNLAAPLDKDFSLIAELIIAHLNTFAGWSCVVVAPVNSSSRFDRELNGRFPSTLFSENIVSTWHFADRETYLQSLKSRRRSGLRSKLRALERSSAIEAKLIVNGEDYLAIAGDLESLNNARQDRIQRSDSYLSMARECYRELFNEGEMTLLEVRAENELVAYRLGFIHGNTYFDWNISYSKDFEKYSPGRVSFVYLSDFLGQLGVTSIDFMAGVYEFKLECLAKPAIQQNYLYVLSSRGLKARFLEWYFLFGRNKLRAIYQILTRRKS